MAGCPPSAASCPNISYAEYNSKGPGANPRARVKWSRQLSSAEAAQITLAYVLKGWTPPGIAKWASPGDAPNDIMSPADDADSALGRGVIASPAARVGDAWGTNIHWTAPPGGEAEAAMLAQAFRLARMDFSWGAIERQKGVYDFAAYDALLAVMRAHGVRPYWILDYGNPLYPPAPPPPGTRIRGVIAASSHREGQGSTLQFSVALAA